MTLRNRGAARLRSVVIGGNHDDLVAVSAEGDNSNCR
jgi:hypothetical protein